MKPTCEKPWRTVLCKLSITLALFMFMTDCGVAAEKAAGLSPEKMFKSNAPLNIASDRMEVSQNDHTIIFEGHVVIRQDDMTITGKQLKITGVEGAKKTDESSMMDKIDRIEVEGDVRITQQDKLATADKAVYYHQEQKILLMGRPMVSQGPDTLKGRLITLYIADGKSVVEGGEETPVQAVLHPSSKDGADSKAPKGLKSMTKAKAPKAPASKKD